MLLGLVALSAVLATSQASAGAVGKLTVNSTSNTNDGLCNGPPNDNAVGNCTLREAFNEANAGLADEINFHPAVFPQSTHGVIQLELGLGPLPPLLREVTINAKGVGVVLDGDYDNDGVGVPWGIMVLPTHNGFDFTLNGGGNTFIIQDIGCDPRVTNGIAGPGIICIRGGGADSVSGPGNSLGVVSGVGIVFNGFCFAAGSGGAVAGGFDDFCCTFISGGATDLLAPTCQINCPSGGGDQAVEGTEIIICPNGESVAGPPIGVSGAFSLGDVIIDGIEIHNAMNSAGIIMEVPNVSNAQVTNSWIEADQDGVGIFTFSPPWLPNGELVDNNVHINGNRISGGLGTTLFGGPEDGNNQVAGFGPGSGSGVDIDFCCDLGSKITADVSSNEAITGNGGHGVWLTYCWSLLCQSHNGSAWNFTINDNGKISGFGDAVNVEINSTDNSSNPIDQEGSHLNASIEIARNAIMDGETDDGVDASIDICCANSDSMGSININDNDDIVGDDNGVDVNQFICCSADNVSYTSVSRNGRITGEGDDGVDVEVHAGSGDTTQDSDENTTTVDIVANDNIAGDNGEALDIEASSGKADGTGDADRNVTNVNITDNDHLDGDDNGVQVFSFAGTQGGPGDADDNVATLTFTGNDDVDGADDDGVDVEVAAGTTAGLGGPANTTGDHNTATALVNENDDIKGHDGDAVDVYVFAGGHSDTGEGNATTIEVIHNDDLHGEGSGHDGIHTESVVCCDADGSGTNDITISRNDNVVGHDGDGIDVDQICCSFNTVTIQQNDNVAGNDGQGIEITPCLLSGDATAPDEIVLDDVTCMADSITILNVTENNVINSGLDGILVCCGLFQFPVTQAPGDDAGTAGAVFKSVIASNVINHNGEDGIDLDTTIGINVVHNTVTENGTSVLDGDNGIEIDWQFGYQIWTGNNNIPSTSVKVPAHFNRISENTTYDNVGLGINLIGTFFTIGAVPGSGTEFPTGSDGVGCEQFPETPIAANDCIPYPKLLFTGGSSVAKVSGTACANCLVEIFLADQTPADQTGPLGRQFGEGRTYLVTATADDLGGFSIDLPCGLSGGGLTATATDKLKNTSEFSSNVLFPGTPGCPAATPAPTDAPAGPTATPGAPEPTAPAQPTATAGPSALCGDVNSDGAVNSVDASIILQKQAGLIAALPKGEASGDVNGDGVANSIDASVILQRAAAMIGPAGLHCT